MDLLHLKARKGKTSMQKKSRASVGSRGTEDFLEVRQICAEGEEAKYAFLTPTQLQGSVLDP